MNWNWQRALEYDLGITEAEIADMELTKTTRARRACKQADENVAHEACNTAAACPCNG